MGKLADYQIQDGLALLDAVKENHEELALKGFTAAKETALSNAYNEAKLKNGAQQKAMELAEDKTAEQNAAFNKLLKLITRIQTAAKGEYGNTSPSLKKFKVGDKQPHSAKKLASWGEYFTTIVLEYHDILLNNGFMQEDITEFHNAYALLLASDSTQENTKKVQSSTTISRDKAIRNLKLQVDKTRNFVKTAFAGDEEMLVKFKAIPKGRTGGGNNGNAGETGPKPS